MINKNINDFDIYCKKMLPFVDESFLKKCGQNFLNFVNMCNDQLTFDNFGDGSAAPSITPITCSDNDVNEWKYQGVEITCAELRNMDVSEQVDICTKRRAKRNCKSTCNICGSA